MRKYSSFLHRCTHFLHFFRSIIIIMDKLAETEADIQCFIRNFRRLGDYVECVNFVYIKIVEFPKVDRIRYGNKERYCVYISHADKMAVLAQCGRYECRYILLT